MLSFNSAIDFELGKFVSLKIGKEKPVCNKVVNADFKMKTQWRQYNIVN